MAPNPANARTVKAFIAAPAFPYGLLLLVVGVVFGAALGHDFVWDDHIYLLNKPVYQAFDLQRIFCSLANDLEYLPVRDLSYAMDWAIWGRNPFGFHLTNLLLYAANVCVAYRLTVRLAIFLGAPPATIRTTGLLTATLFALHPLHVEVVSFITGRNALLSGLFAFLACLAFLDLIEDRCRWRAYPLALCWFTLALFSKATSISLPLVFCLLVLLARQGRKTALLAAILPFLGLALSSFFLFRTIALRSFLMQSEQTSFTLATIAQKIAIASQIPWFYLAKLLLPLNLTPEYTVRFTAELAMPLALAAFLGLVGLTAAAYRLRTTQPQFLFGLGWFLLTMIPVLHIFPTYPVVADRYVYLPSFGVAYLLAATVAPWASARRPVAIGAGMVLLALALLTFQQNLVWRTAETLWQHTIRISPRSVKAYTNLGRIDFSAGRYKAAFARFDQARQLAPADPHYDFFEGMLYFVRSDYQPALHHFEQALARTNDFLEALFHAALAHEALGHRDQAIAFFTKTIQSKQDDLGNFKLTARQRLRELQMSDAIKPAR